MTEIGQYCFFECHSLTHIEIPSSVTVLEDSTFRECSMLVHISLPPKLIKIGCHCFEGCISLKEISIPSIVKQIGCFAFKNCKSLNEFEIPSYVVSIEPYTFYNCESLKKVEIPNSVVSIKDYSFQLCKSLENVTIPASVKEIGDGAFMQCNSLKHLLIPSSVTSIGHDYYIRSVALASSFYSFDNNGSNEDELNSNHRIHSRYKIDINKFGKKRRRFDNNFLIVKKINSYKDYLEKVLPHLCLSDDQILNNITDDEIRLHINADHPTFAKFYGYSFQNRNEKNLKIIMDYPNDSVGDLIQSVRMALAPIEYNNTKRQIFLIGVSRAMKFLHDCNINCININPKNVFVDDNLYPHINCSFLYRPNAPDYYNNIPCYYLAPEIIKKSEYGEKSDVYQFGMFMFEVITEKLPFRELGDVSAFQLQKKIVDYNLRPNIYDVFVEQPMRELIEKCWSPNPEERPTFKEIFRKLAYDKDYFLYGVDEYEIQDYVDDITFM